jgi:DNA-binding PadR family transcriptional regulator
MNYAMHMHPFWGATQGPEGVRTSMQNWDPEPPNGGFGYRRADSASMSDEAPSPGKRDPQGTVGEPRPGGGRRRHRGRHHGGSRMDWIEDPIGPMFGPDSSYRRKQGGRGRRNRGVVRAAVLLLLDEKPRHGYEILTELADRSDGTWRPSPGSVYPVLKALAADGFVRPEQVAGRRVFHLTAEGRTFVDSQRDSWGKPWQTDSPATTPGLDDLRDETRQLFGAVRQVGQAGNEQQLRLAAATLARSRKAIYLMLAGVETGDGDSEPLDRHESTNETSGNQG